jgi:hypothetical protein
MYLTKVKIYNNDGNKAGITWLIIGGLMQERSYTFRRCCNKKCI